MDKLLAIVEKLKSEIVPDQPVGKMSKPDLLSFLDGAKIVERMKVFHQKGEKGLRSAITDDEDDAFVPSEAELRKWRVGKIRKMLRNFHRATQITKKYAKFTASRLRSHIKRHRYEEMLFGEDLPDVDDMESPRSPKGKPRPVNGRRTRDKVTKTIEKGFGGNIIINTGDNPASKDKKEDCCCDEPNLLADQDFFGLVQSLAPNLYKVLAEKSFLLDMCSLDRKRMEANVCPMYSKGLGLYHVL